MLYRFYILRPETVESYFLLWRLTKEEKYRDWGWEMVEAIDNHCKIEGGFSGIRNVYKVIIFVYEVFLSSIAMLFSN